MNKEQKHWLAVYLTPYVLIGIFTLGAGLFLLPLGGIAGVFVGLTSTAPYFTSSFKLALAAALVFAVTLFIIGYKFRNQFWGKALNAAGVYLWCLSGLIGFGPQ